MDLHEIKARRVYLTQAFPTCGVRSERVRVLGFETVPGYVSPRDGTVYPPEVWCRVRDERGHVTLLHPSRLACPAVDVAYVASPGGDGVAFVAEPAL